MNPETVHPAAADGQDFHRFLERYRAEHPEDVLVIADEVSGDQEITAVVAQLAAEGRDPLVLFERVDGLATPVVTNTFASRVRISRPTSSIASSTPSSRGGRSTG